MIAVSGATGTIGSELVRLLMTTKADMTALVRDTGRARRLLGPDVELREVDLADAETVAPALDGVQTLFLLSKCSTALPAATPRPADHEPEGEGRSWQDA